MDSNDESQSSGDEYLPSSEDSATDEESTLYSIDKICEVLEEDGIPICKSVKPSQIVGSKKRRLIGIHPECSKQLNSTPTTAVAEEENINFYDLSFTDGETILDLPVVCDGSEGYISLFNEVPTFQNEDVQPPEALEPREADEPPLEAVEPPAETFEPAAEAVEPPGEAVEPPVGSFEQPVAAVEVAEPDTSLNKARRKRRSVASPKKWTKNSEKLKRAVGESYVGYRLDKENKKIIQDSPKNARAMGPPCSSPMCIKSSTKLCGQVDDAERKKMFDSFWRDMSWDTKKMFVCSTVQIAPPKRRYSTARSRMSTFSYHLRVNGEKIPVCQGMYLSTLGLKRSEVRYWVENFRQNNMPGTCSHNNKTYDDTRIDETETTSEQSLPLEENNALVNGAIKASTSLARHETLNEFFNSLPNMPSHYCRKSSTMKYLQADIKTWVQLYKLYQNYCEALGQQCFNRFTFDRVRKKNKLAIYSPKKDRCDTCLSHEMGHINDHYYQAHRRKKDAAQEEKTADKEAALRGELWALCFDLMNVQTVPKIRASSAFYKLKLTLHNFTVYNLASHEAMLYWFDESEANLGAATFASCIVDSIMNLIDKEKKPVVLFSDGCSYQNRNAILANALLHVAVTTQVPITHKYLEKGHTHMECDSVHSVVERYYEDIDIFLPSQYVTLSKLARKNPKPYGSRYVDHSFFKNYGHEQSMAYTSIRPGRKKGEPTVTDIRALLYKPEGIIYYKLDFHDEFKPIPMRPKKVVFKLDFPNLFESRQLIPKDKFQDLQSLKPFLPKDAHDFYDNLCHEEVSRRQEIRKKEKENGQKRRAKK